MARVLLWLWALAALVCGGASVSRIDLPSLEKPYEQSIDVDGHSFLQLAGSVEPCAVNAHTLNVGIIRVRFVGGNGRRLKTQSLSWSKFLGDNFFYLHGAPYRISFSRKIAVPDGATRMKVLVSRYKGNHEVVITRFSCETAGVKPRWQFPIPIVSIWFLLFVGVLACFYFILPRILRPWVLLLGSLGFYASFNYFALPMIACSAASIWLGGLGIEKIRRGKGVIAGLVVTINVGILLVAKYSGWMVEGVCGWFDWQSPVFSIVLPLGISFYTLQAVSYMTDVYRGGIPPERNFFKLFLYLIFFPTVMQGPISRYGQLGYQLWTPHGFSWERMQSGLQLVLWGFFKKMVIADRVAMIVNAVFSSGSTAEGFPVLLGVIGYSIQIYADFSGCVDICRGISEMLGIELIDNFKHPYFATSIKDFWRRWHISLSSWLKDYVYIPLGGNRKGNFRKYLNILIVFGVSGVWHGVGLNFLVWGVLHGVYQIADALTTGIRERALGVCRVDKTSWWFVLVQRLETFALVTLAWVFFRAPTLSDAWSVLKRLRVLQPRIWLAGQHLAPGVDIKDLSVLIVALVILLGGSILQERGCVRQMLARQPLWLRWPVYWLGLFSVLIFGIYGPGYNASQFIYMQF